MMKKIILVPVLLIATIATVGCSTAPVQTAYGVMPQYCTQNNTATGAIVGTLLGAAVGGAIGGGRGAAIGAVSGLALGGLTGAQADAQCQQIAYENVIAMAEAAQAQAMAQAAAQSAAAPRQVEYQSFDYVTPSTGVQHKVTVAALNNYTNPATKEKCSVLKDVSFAEGGAISNTTSHEVCKSANGTLHQV
jgi:YMGG-like Gly-zipper